jgi:hypothetical protein
LNTSSSRGSSNGRGRTTTITTAVVSRADRQLQRTLTAQMMTCGLPSNCKSFESAARVRDSGKQSMTRPSGYVGRHPLMLPVKECVLHKVRAPQARKVFRAAATSEGLVKTIMKLDRHSSFDPATQQILNDLNHPTNPKIRSWKYECRHWLKQHGRVKKEEELSLVGLKQLRSLLASHNSNSSGGDDDAFDPGVDS